MSRQGFPSLDHEPKTRGGPPSYKNTLIMDTDTWSQYSSSTGGLGKRRNSWTNLVESDENLNKHKVNVYPKVSAPFKQPSLSSASSVTSSDNVHTTDLFRQYVPRSSYPVMADPAMLNVRPAGSLPPPSKAPSVAMSPMPHSASVIPPKTPSVKRNRLQEWKKRCCTPCLALILLALLLIGIIAAIIAIVLTQVLKTPKEATMTWLPPESLRGGQNQSSTVRMTAEGDQIKLQLQGALPFKGNYISYYDFQTNKVIIVDESLRGNGRQLACFVLPLDRNNLQGSTEMRKASNAGKKKTAMTNGWQESWMFIPNPMASPPQLSTPVKECEGARWIQLDPTSMDQKSRKCSDCYDFCLPDYGIERSDGDEFLNIQRRDCFYLFVPEWRSYAQAYSIEQNQKDFEQYYRNRVHLNPSFGGPNGESKWISLSVPPNVANAANSAAQTAGGIGGAIQNAVQGAKTAVFGGNGQPGLYGTVANAIGNGQQPYQTNQNTQNGVPNQEVTGIVNLQGVNGNNGNNMYQMGNVGSYNPQVGNMNGATSYSQPYGQPAVNGQTQQANNGYGNPAQPQNGQPQPMASGYTPNVAANPTDTQNGAQAYANTGYQPNTMQNNNGQTMNNGPVVNSQNTQPGFQAPYPSASGYSGDMVRAPPRYTGNILNVQPQQQTSGYTPDIAQNGNGNQGIAGMELPQNANNGGNNYSPNVANTQPNGRWIRNY